MMLKYVLCSIVGLSLLLGADVAKNKPTVSTPKIPVEVSEELFRAVTDLLQAQAALDHTAEADIVKNRQAAVTAAQQKAANICTTEFHMERDKESGKLICVVNPQPAESKDK